VDVGIRDERFVEVVSGVEPGEPVAAEPAGKVEPGARVRARPRNVRG
jgi:hypothetical protein